MTHPLGIQLPRGGLWGISQLLCPDHSLRGILGGCLQAQRYITQLKAQVNSLEGEVEEQRKQKQKALVDNEQLRDELERLQQAKQDSERSLRLCAEAESTCLVHWPHKGLVAT